MSSLGAVYICNRPRVATIPSRGVDIGEDVLDESPAVAGVLNELEGENLHATGQSNPSRDPRFDDTDVVCVRGPSHGILLANSQALLEKWLDGIELQFGRAEG